MKYSHWPDSSYPTYIDQTDEELVELAKSHPDTVRIMTFSDNRMDSADGKEHLAIASGYGNTHESVQVAYRLASGAKRAHGWDYILYKKGQEWVFNMLGHTEGCLLGDDECVAADVAIPQIGFEDTLKELIKLLKEYL